MDKNFVSKSTIDNKKKAKTEYLKEKLKQVNKCFVILLALLLHYNNYLA